MIIRDATEADAAEISAIWNPVIRDTAITFWPTERSPADVAALIRLREHDNHGFFVAEQDKAVVAFAAYGQFRTGGGYAKALEHTIYAAAKAQGTCIARKLLAHLEGHARARGGRVMIGMVTADNPASLAFHRACGYEEWGFLRNVGWKFDQFHDAHLMGKDLGAPSA